MKCCLLEVPYFMERSRVQFVIINLIKGRPTTFYRLLGHEMSPCLTTAFISFGNQHPVVGIMKYGKAEMAFIFVRTDSSPPQLQPRSYWHTRAQYIPIHHCTHLWNMPWSFRSHSHPFCFGCYFWWIWRLGRFREIVPFEMLNSCVADLHS